MQGDPYGTQSGVYGLAHLIHSYLTGMRYEPTGIPPLTPDRAAMAGPQIVGNELQRNPDAIAAGESAVDSAMDQAMTEQWQQRMQQARDPTGAKGQKRADKQATKDWINKMRAAKQGQKAVGSELAKPNPDDPMVKALRGAQETLAGRGAGETGKAIGIPPEPMPMTPPMATEPEPWKTPSNTPGGFWGGHAVRHSLFGTEPKNPDPQE